jgi:hypothetical protein
MGEATNTKMRLKQPFRWLTKFMPEVPTPRTRHVSDADGQSRTPTLPKLRAFGIH